MPVKLHPRRRHPGGAPRRCAAGLTAGLIAGLIAGSIAGLLVAAWATTAPAEILYKNYVIRRLQGMDILCDPYIVQPNDWLIKLFKQRGEISQSDFPQFISLFERLNPQVSNINRIQVGQQILIPLKKLKRDALPGQETGVVTIPFVTVSNLAEEVLKFTRRYRIQRGDSVSRLTAAEFGAVGTRGYRRGLALFRHLNPAITDLNRIYVGQQVVLPLATMRQQEWYASLFDTRGRVRIPDRKPSAVTALPPPAAAPPAERSGDDVPTPQAAAARALNTRLIDRGTYYFPRPGRKDVALDLARFPLIDLKNGTRLMFSRADARLTGDQRQAIERFWRDVHIIPEDREASAEYVIDSVLERIGRNRPTPPLHFSDAGVAVEVRARWILPLPARQGGPRRHVCVTLIDDPAQRTAAPVRGYLEARGVIIKDITVTRDTGPISRPVPRVTADDDEPIRLTGDKKGYAADLLALLGYPLVKNVSITFPYAGIQVLARTNLVSRPTHTPLLVDFGELYGDAAAAIRGNGFDIVSITESDSYAAVTRKLLEGLSVPHRASPVFSGARRDETYNTSIALPGFLVPRANGPDLLLTAGRLAPELKEFLRSRDVALALFPSAGRP